MQHPNFAAVKKQKRAIVLEDVLVQDYAAEGKCLARVDGKVIFIEGTVPGDITKRKTGDKDEQKIYRFYKKRSKICRAHRTEVDVVIGRVSVSF